MSYLYKYFRLNKNFLIVLKKNKLWFSAPAHFNDPFDCNINSCDKFSGDYESFLNFFGGKIIGLESEDEQISAFEEFRNNRLGDAFWTPVKEALNKKGVCCFSKNIKSLLMWSHYADSHKGLCLVFNKEKLEKGWNTVFSDVRYPTKYPSINDFKNSSHFIYGTTIVKYKEWKYEKEVRVFSVNFGLHPYDKEALEGIIFGAKCPNEDMVKVIKLTLSLGLKDLTYQKAFLHKEKFQLAFIKLPPLHDFKDFQ